MKTIILISALVLNSLAMVADFSVDQFADIKKSWLLNEPKSYKYTLRHGGVFGYTLFKITIRQGACKAKSLYIFGKSRHNWEKSTCEGYRIHELISSAQEQELKGVIKSEIKINTEYGFISYYSAEPKTDLTDQDWYFEVLKFEEK